MDGDDSTEYLERAYAQGTVVSKSLGEEMSLVGFVPYSVSFAFYQLSMYINLNDTLIVTPYFLRFSQDECIWPIFKTIRLAKNRKYDLDENITVCTLQEEGSSKKNKATKFPYVSGDLHKKDIKSIKDKSLFEVSETGAISYIARMNEFELYDGFGKMRYITNDFLCLCKYMNKVTGLPSYVVLPSYDTIRAIKKD